MIFRNGALQTVRDLEPEERKSVRLQISYLSYPPNLYA
jgi:hypothetical protein